MINRALTLPLLVIGLENTFDSAVAISNAGACKLFQSTMCEAISVECSSCYACEDVAETLYQCIADTFGCSSFDCPTSLPTTAPTPVAVSSVCAAELENARTCLDQQNVFQRSCTECTSWVDHCARRDARFLSLLTLFANFTTKV